MPNVIVQIARFLASFAILQCVPLAIVVVFWLITLGAFSFIDVVHSDTFFGCNVIFALFVNTLASGCIVDEYNNK